MAAADSDKSPGTQTCSRPRWSVDSLRENGIFPSAEYRSNSIAVDAASPVTSLVRTSNTAGTPESNAEGPVTSKRKCWAAIAALEPIVAIPGE